jgi:hypothetical protein
MTDAFFHPRLGILITNFGPTMRSPMFLLSLSRTFIITSSAWLNDSSLQPLGGGSTRPTVRDSDIDMTCRRLRTLTKLNEIANNETMLNTIDVHGKLAQERIDWIKKNSADITAKLEKLTSNTTLTAECDTINAQRDAARECKTLETLEKLVNSTNGQTIIDKGPAADFLNEEQKQKLQENFEKAELKLQELRSNDTLMGICTNSIMLQQNGAIGSRKYLLHCAYSYVLTYKQKWWIPAALSV